MCVCVCEHAHACSCVCILILKIHLRFASSSNSSDGDLHLIIFSLLHTCVSDCWIKLDLTSASLTLKAVYWVGVCVFCGWGVCIVLFYRS